MGGGGKRKGRQKTDSFYAHETERDRMRQREFVNYSEKHFDRQSQRQSQRQ